MLGPTSTPKETAAYKHFKRTLVFLNFKIPRKIWWFYDNWPEMGQELGKIYFGHTSNTNKTKNVFTIFTC